MNSVDDAQKVLDAYRIGQVKILGKNAQGFLVVKFEGVTGINVMVFDYLTTGSIGPLGVGLPRAEVRSCLGKEFRTFKKTFLSSNTLDAFDHHAVHVYYDDADLVKGVELFSSVNFFWRGKRLLDESYAELKKYLVHQDVVFSSDDFGIEVDALGMGFYIPDISEDGDFATVKSVYIDLTVG